MRESYTLQEGILAEGLGFGFCGEWRLTASPARALAVLSKLQPGSTVIGIGKPLLDRLGVVVPGLQTFSRRWAADKVMPATQQDLWSFVTAPDPSLLNDAVLALKRTLGQAFTLVQSANMFRYHDGLEPSGHIDGTANVTGDEMSRITALAGNDYSNGTFAMVQRYVYFDALLDHISNDQRDLAFGRKLDGNDEIEDAPESAHVKRTDQDASDAGGNILRRSMPFTSANRRGTQFISYSNDLSHITIKLDRMVGAVDGISDAILQFTQAETGAFYFCPAMAGPYLDIKFMAQGDASMTQDTNNGWGVVAGPEADILFNGKRCIHSRHCVLDRPDVFVPNVEGEWIHPENATGAEIAALAHNCPSGAIRYRAHNGGKDETAPLVNVIVVRENGPYAVHADLQVAGREPEFRATLCRCGQSANKPYCDNSHIKSGFVASGEPQAKQAPALEKRNGPLIVAPLPDGPLMVQGSVELIAGTGHRITQTSKVALCRCGHSQNKPYCDGSHVAANFHAD